MHSNSSQNLSRRERQIMDVIYARGTATSAEVLKALPNPPSYSCVRALLRILEDKGYLHHREEGQRYVFLPMESREKASRSALQRVVQTFFDGSLVNAVSALVDAGDAKLTPDELKKIEAIIKSAKSK